MRLFCFPFAGGGATAYRNWQQSSPSWLDICPVQLPGRESRFREEPFTELDSLVSLTTEALLPMLRVPFAFFGHSMGALIAYELTIRLAQERLGMPVKLFASAARAPHLDSTTPPRHLLPDNEFMDAVCEFDGIPSEVLANGELLDIVLATLRADFRLCETYQFRGSGRLGCPIRAFAGSSDRSPTLEEVRPWRDLTDVDFDMTIFPGGHFFLREHGRELLQAVAAELAPHRGQTEQRRPTTASPENPP